MVVGVNNRRPALLQPAPSRPWRESEERAYSAFQLVQCTRWPLQRLG